MKYVVLLFLMTACGSKSSDDAAPTTPNFDGTYATLCTPSSSGSTATKTVRTYTGSQVSADIITYGDNTCSTELFRGTEVASFMLGATIAPLTYKRDSTVSSVQFTIAKDDQVPLAKAAKLYGFTDWAKGVPRDIAGLRNVEGSAPEDKKGQVIYSLVKLDGTKLYQGDFASGDGTTDAKRPTSLDTTNVATRQ